MYVLLNNAAFGLPGSLQTGFIPEQVALIYVNAFSPLIAGESILGLD